MPPPRPTHTRQSLSSGLVYRLNWATLYKHAGMVCRRTVKWEAARSGSRARVRATQEGDAWTEGMGYEEEEVEAVEKWRYEWELRLRVISVYKSV